MKSILVGISLSKQSPIVLKFALRMAQYHNAQLVVGYILDSEKEEIKNAEIPEDMTKEEFLENYRQRKQVELDNYVQAHFPKQYYNVISDSVAVYGFPDEELQRIAIDKSVELIVVGKLTKTGDALLKDVSTQLLEWSPCPIFIVPEDAEFKAFNRIIYATDFELEDCSCLFYFQDWLSAFDAKMVGLNISKDEGVFQNGGTKIDVLKQLFPSKNIVFQNLTLEVGEKISDQFPLNPTDLIATRLQDRKLWKGNLKTKMNEAITMKMERPIIVFQ